MKAKAKVGKVIRVGDRAKSRFEFGILDCDLLILEPAEERELSLVDLILEFFSGGKKRIPVLERMVDGLVVPVDSPSALNVGDVVEVEVSVVG